MTFVDSNADKLREGFYLAGSRRELRYVLPIRGREDDKFEIFEPSEEKGRAMITADAVILTPVADPRKYLGDLRKGVAFMEERLGGGE